MNPNDLFSHLVEAVVERDLSPSQFVSILKRHASASDLEKINLDTLTQTYDLSAWSPYFLPAIRSLLNHPDPSDDSPADDLRSSPATSSSDSLALSDGLFMSAAPPAAANESSLGARASGSKRQVIDVDAEFSMSDAHDQSSEDDNGSDYCDSPPAGSSRRRAARASASRRSRATTARSTNVQPASALSTAAPSTNDQSGSASGTAGPSASVQSANAHPPVVPQASSGAQTDPADPYYEPTFPPGRDLPGFVPFGQRGAASVAQGNHWPIDLALRDKILVGEVDGHDLRGTGISFEQVLAKYSAWQGHVTASTLRGRKRVHTVAAEHRGRVVQFDNVHLDALRAAIPGATDSNGDVKWMRVREAVIDATGRPFGASTLRKQWERMEEMN